MKEGTAGRDATASNSRSLLSQAACETDAAAARVIFVILLILSILSPAVQ